MPYGSGRVRNFDYPGELIVLSPEDQRQAMVSAGGLLICFVVRTAVGNVALVHDGMQPEASTTSRTAIESTIESTIHGRCETVTARR